MKILLKNDFIRFCLVGASGFALNYLIVTNLNKHLNFSIFTAQLIGAEVSLFSNFILHHHWTYRYNKVTKKIANLIWQFHASSWVSIIGITLMVTIGVHTFKLPYVAALVISSAIALGWNYYWTKYSIWNHENITSERS